MIGPAEPCSPHIVGEIGKEDQEGPADIEYLPVLAEHVGTDAQIRDVGHAGDAARNVI